MKLSVDNNFLRRRWLDFRNGHSIYLVFAMTFANFITIQYKLLIGQAPFLNDLFGNILVFAVVFLVIYIPLSMILGYWHRKNQFLVESDALFRENKVGAIMWLYIIDLIDGKVDEEDRKKMREILMKISRGSTRLYDRAEVTSQEPSPSPSKS
jgi:hypothetical protein